jgi:non-ribosomal peptide synthase protein (TIGR01720 family)
VPDLVAAGQAVMAGQRPRLPAVGTSFRRWAQHLLDWAQDSARCEEVPVWVAGRDGTDPLLTDRVLDPAADVVGTSGSVTVTLPTERTAPLLTRVPAVFHGGVNDVLLTALAVAVAQWRHRHRHGRGEGTAVLVDVEGHGREDIVEGLDLSRTVGWFTSVFPVRVDPGVGFDQVRAGGPAVGTALKRVKEQLRALPSNGVSYGALRYLNPQTGPLLAGLAPPQIGFNYLGRFPTPTPGPAEWVLAADTGVFDVGADPGMPLAHGLELNAYTSEHPEGPQLHAHWSWAQGLWSEPDIQEIAHTWFNVLDLLTAYADQPNTSGHTPSDQELEVLFPLRPTGTRIPLFCIHPAMGLSWCYAGLASLLGSDQQIYGLQARGIARAEPLPKDIEEIAASYLDQVRLIQPNGPYNLLGWSFGGYVAHAIAAKLQDQGEQVALLAILDEYPSVMDQHEDSASGIKYC